MLLSLRTSGDDVQAILPRLFSHLGRLFPPALCEDKGCVLSIRKEVRDFSIMFRFLYGTPYAEYSTLIQRFKRNLFERECWEGLHGQHYSVRRRLQSVS